MIMMTISTNRRLKSSAIGRFTSRLCELGKFCKVLELITKESSNLIGGNQSSTMICTFTARRHNIFPGAACTIATARAEKMLAIHWGTFDLADEPMDEPPRLLRAAVDSLVIDPARVWIFHPGETRWIDENIS